MKISHVWTCALMAILVAGCATERNAPTSADAAAYFAQDFTCTSAGAANVNLSVLERAPERYADQCVRVTAFVKDGVPYLDAADAQANPSSPRLALAFNDGALERRLRLGPSFADLTARVRLCARLQAMAALMPNRTSKGTCKSAVAALYVSQATVVPTAMD